MGISPDEHFARIEAEAERKARVKEVERKARERAAGAPATDNTDNADNAVTPPTPAVRVPTGGPRPTAPSQGGVPGDASASAGEITLEKIRDLLHEVIDPELGIDIVELGLLRDVRIAGGLIDVDFTVTSPACPLSDFIEDEIRACLDWLPGIKRVNVSLVMEPPWDPEQMSDSARRALGWGD